MLRSLCLLLLLVSFTSVVISQVFTIGMLDQDLLSYISTTVYPNFTLSLITLPLLNSEDNYRAATIILLNYDVIIGRFDYTVATICQQINLAYFFLGDTTSTFPGVLLEVGTDLITESQMLSIYLNKYNINYPIRFISDSSTDAVNFRASFGELPVSQCNFNPIDNVQSILVCYNLVFKSSTPATYIFIADPSNRNNMDTYIETSLLMSLPYKSLIFFPMVDIDDVFGKYYFCGGFLFEVTPEVTTLSQTGDLLKRKAMVAYAQIYASLKLYRKVSTTAWISNNVTYQFNNSVILNTIKTTGGLYQTNGQMTSKTSYIYTVYNQTLAPVTSFTYSSNIWIESPGVPNPATVGSKGAISIVYILDNTFITEVNIQGGVILNGFAIDLLNNLLPPIQLSFTAVKYTAVPTIGTSVGNVFNGMLGQMTAGNYTMTVFPVPIIAAYQNQLTYSNELFNIQYSMLIRQANKTVQFYKLSQPFSPLVWIVILVIIVFLSLLVFFTNLISPNVGESIDRPSISNSIFMVFGSFLVAKMLVKPNMFSLQIFYLLIWLGTLLLIASYASNLFVVTAFENSTKIQFTSMTQLLKQKNYQWAFVNNSYLHNSILADIANNISSTYSEMFTYAQNNWKNNYLIAPENVEQFAMNFSEIGVLNDNLHNMKISLQNCFLTTLVDNTVSFPVAYVMNPGFQYFQDFANQIMTLRASGAVDLLLTKYFQSGICSTGTVRNGGINPFGYEDMCGIFILVSVGIILSLIVAVIEYLLKKGNLQCQRLVKGNSLQFGQIYKAKVRALDKRGVTVDIGRQSCFSRKDDARIYYIPKENLIGKGKKKDEIPSPTEQGIMIGTSLYLKYLGNNPVDSKRKFIQVSKK